MADKCKECGCICVQCSQNNQNHADMHLHVEIEHLRQRLLERDSHIVTMETQFLNEADKFPNGELASIKEEMLTWQEKYARLYEAHKRVQKVNQNLEDKLLRIVDKCETEKSAFTKDIATLSHRLADANYTIHRLTQDNEKYRNDVNLAIQLLQCKPSNFVSQRYDSLPSEVQAKVRTYVAQKRIPGDAIAPPDVKSITVPISTFPPTAMVYNVTKTLNVEKDSDDESDDSKPPVDIVSAAIMAKVLEERERERVFAKHCDTCTCHRSILTNDVETQTVTGGRTILDNVANQNVDSTNNYNSTELTSQSQTQTHTLNPNDTDYGGNTNGNNTTKRTSFQCVNERNSSRTPSIRNECFFNSFEKDCATNSMRLGQSSKSGEYSQFKTNNKNSYALISDGPQNEVSKKIVNQTNGPSPIKQATFHHNVGEKTHLSKINSEKSRGHIGRVSKKPDAQSAYRLSRTCGEWPKYKQVPSCEVDLIDLKQNSLPQRQLDVINDRIWKNEWSRANSTKRGSKSTADTQADTSKSEISDQMIDVINDRTWKSVDGGVRYDGNISNPRLTLIEVKPLVMDTVVQQHSDSGLQQLEDTASPSFSSDSLVISSSDPPSTSSDQISQVGSNRLVNKTLINNNHNTNNNNNNSNNNNHNHNNILMSNWQDRTTGPRGCSMRITPGSKNILLDNAGHYQTILYTSGSGNGAGRPNTALVHAAKSTKSGRSTSTSSDENSPVLPTDNTQLQRVAEWVKASGPLERQMSLKSANLELKSNDDMSIKTLNSALSKIKDAKLQGNEKQNIVSSNLNRGTELPLNLTNSCNGKNLQTLGNSKIVNGQQDTEISHDSCDHIQNYSSRDSESSLHSLKDDHADLITFESPIDDGKHFLQFSTCSLAGANERSVAGENASVPMNMDVKVTREMQETYLKLAASLDPASLELSSSESADITIEKYRKEYKRTHVQKHQDKTGSTS